MEAILVPIAFFVALTVIGSFFFWFLHRSRRDMQQTIRAAVEKGQELTPELVASLGSRRKPSKDRDLRLALLWLAIAASFALFGAAMSAIAEEVLTVMLACAAFPGMIGLAYLVMWRFTERAQ